MEFDFKKYFIIVGIFAGVCFYIKSNYTPQDVLAYAHKNRDMSTAPAIDYYIGIAYFMKGNYKQSNEAFNQLLADYTTCQYTAGSLYHLGEAYEEMLNIPAAKDSYEQYTTRFPDGKDLSLVQKKYEQIKFR